MGICMLQTANRNRNSTKPLDTKPFKTKPNTNPKSKRKQTQPEKDKILIVRFIFKRSNKYRI